MRGSGTRIKPEQTEFYRYFTAGGLALGLLDNITFPMLLVNGTPGTGPCCLVVGNPPFRRVCLVFRTPTPADRVHLERAGLLGWPEDPQKGVAP